MQSIKIVSANSLGAVLTKLTHAILTRGSPLLWIGTTSEPPETVASLRIFTNLFTVFEKRTSAAAASCLFRQPNWRITSVSDGVGSFCVVSFTGTYRDLQYRNGENKPLFRVLYSTWQRRSWSCSTNPSDCLITFAILGFHGPVLSVSQWEYPCQNLSISSTTTVRGRF